MLDVEFLLILGLDDAVEVVVLTARGRSTVIVLGGRREGSRIRNPI